MSKKQNDKVLRSLNFFKLKIRKKIDLIFKNTENRKTKIWNLIQKWKPKINDTEQTTPTSLQHLQTSSLAAANGLMTQNPQLKFVKVAKIHKTHSHFLLRVSN